jgi:AAA+ ATPase superfamily predicted ATPase
MELIGRNREIETLQRYRDSDDPEFVVLYGRRRVGKTYLIRQFFHDKFFFYVTGVSPNSDSSDSDLKSFDSASSGATGPDAGSSMVSNLERFGVALRKYGITEGKAPGSWMEAFDQLSDGIQRAGPGYRKVIFLDEMPWMDTPRSKFLTALEYFWNGFASSRRDVLFIACGSAASWMTKKIFKNRGGLHNRITGKILLRPFSLYDCEEYFRARDIVMSRRDIAEAYMVFGGIPYYLSYWKGKYGVPWNVDHIVFAEDAPLADEFDNLYRSLFGSSVLYTDIIEALEKKSRGLTREELVGTLSLADGGAVSEALKNLELSGFIRYYSLFPGKVNGGLYQLIDNYSLFHKTFVKTNRGGNEHYWSDKNETPKLNVWRGYAFEQLCFRHADQIKAVLGIAGVATDVYSWRNRRGEKGAQIDLVIDRSDGIVNLCEIKYSKYEYEINKSYAARLDERVRIFEGETKTRKTPHLTLISTYGMKRNRYSGVIRSEVTLDDLFVPARRD